MTYAQFLNAFLLAPIVGLGLLLAPKIRRRHALACGAVCLLAFLYTAPWDNHAAATGLWTFDPRFAPPGHFVLWLPWEEYAFYFLQGILTCLLLLAVANRLRPPGDRDGL